MIFKRKEKKVPLKTSKAVMTTPIHIDDKIVIPIHYINVEVFDLKFPNLFGSIQSKGVVVIDNHESTFLSLDDTLELNDLVNTIPELEKALTQN
ncbi:MAG: hypothetical protein JEZ08_15795 [Clostridiales bacterium]|nr:hypothetical protein [Clostridiales bacterium]